MSKIGIQLLTREEVIKALRLDCRGTDPDNSLNYIIRTGRLKSVKIAGRHLFTAQAVEEYIRSCENKSETT